ncbi:iron ABC transporter permease [Ornithinimicrobium humiphilum]|uniref:Iron complex transport system permease protein n=1 Tax=Ornithinimicrobium humiphilum TaxID=125288 RepID=A0A543KL61_9MICO|nr:iron ABC transporter permease [Ornithinimicrobium humiphilum]TQM95818.1 iron complex transport system permease protein [Ornithinimicrobium humiphilum]
MSAPTTVRPTPPAPAPQAAPARAARRETGKLLVLLAGVLVSALALVVSVTVGTVGIGFADVVEAIRLRIFGGTLAADFAQSYAVITELRLPRVLLAFAAGAGLSVAGVLMQGLLRNPLVSPFTLGVSPAAAFGAALVITLSGSNSLPPWATIAGALVSSLTVSALVLALASVRRMAVATLLLMGIALTQIFEALTSALQFTANENTLQAIVRWTFGSVNDATWSDVRIVGAVVLVALPLTLWFAKDLNAVAFAGDDAARSFGVNVGVLRVGLIGLAVVLAAVVVSFCGIIGFVGLVGPHIARLVIGADHRHLLPFAALSGGLLLLVADAVGRTVIAPAVVPVGIVVAFIGGPMFVYLILTRKNSLK